MICPRISPPEWVVAWAFTYAPPPRSRDELRERRDTARARRRVGPCDGRQDDAADPFEKFFEPPVLNKFTVLVNPDFLTLDAEEWMSSLSKRMMARRVREFLPELRVAHLTTPGTAGVRASVIDRQGNFIKEAIELPGPHSFHITNYNSPGATDAPAYTAWIVNRLASRGFLDHLKPRTEKAEGTWDFERVCAAIETPAS